MCQPGLRIRRQYWTHPCHVCKLKAWPHSISKSNTQVPHTTYTLTSSVARPRGSNTPPVSSLAPTSSDTAGSEDGRDLTVQDVPSLSTPPPRLNAPPPNATPRVPGAWQLAAPKASMIPALMARLGRGCVVMVFLGPGSAYCCPVQHTYPIEKRHPKMIEIFPLLLERTFLLVGLLPSIGDNCRAEVQLQRLLNESL